MPKLFAFILLFALPLLSFDAYHKYYSSVTHIEYVPEQQSVQIISRIFVDDFENVIQKRYNRILALDKKNHVEDVYIKKYLQDKIKISINQQPAKLLFIGKQYETGIIKCYLEIENVKNIQSIEISNTVLFDMFQDQQNTIKTHINSKQKSFTLTQQHKKQLLEF